MSRNIGGDRCFDPFNDDEEERNVTKSQKLREGREPRETSFFDSIASDVATATDVTIAASVISDNCPFSESSFDPFADYDNNVGGSWDIDEGENTSPFQLTKSRIKNARQLPTIQSSNLSCPPPPPPPPPPHPVQQPRTRTSFVNQPTDHQDHHSQPKQQQQPTTIYISAMLKEEIMSIYDSLSDPSYTTLVTGNLNIDWEKSRWAFIGAKPLYLSFQDFSSNVEDLTVYHPNVVIEITEPDTADKTTNPLSHPKKVLPQRKERLFRIDTLNYWNHPKTRLHILKYTCNRNLRPVPMTVQVHVQMSPKSICQVHMILQCNRSYPKGLQDVIVLMCVPPGIMGESIKLSNKGCKWDPLKRLVVWNFPLIRADEIVKDSIDLEMMKHSSVDTKKEMQETLIPKFPIMIRCFGYDRISNIDVRIGMMNEDILPNQQFEADIERTFCLVHRNI